MSHCKRCMKYQRMPVGDLVQIGAITAANHCCDRNAPAPKMLQHLQVTCADTI